MSKDHFEQEENNSDFIDFKTMWRTYRRHWWWFVVSAIVCAGLAFTYSKLHKPVYVINSNLLISKDGGELGIMREMSSFSSLLGAKSSTEDELMILKSHSLMRDVVNELQLTRTHVLRYGPFNLQKLFCFEEYPVDVMPVNAAMTDTLTSSIRFKIKVDSKGLASITAKAEGEKLADLSDVKLPAVVKTRLGDFTVSTTEFMPKDKSVRTDVTISGADELAENLLELFTIETASKKTNVVNISYKHPDVEFGKTLINTLMKRYNTNGLELKNYKAGKTLEFVDKRIESLADELNDTEQQMEDYMRSNGLTNLEADVKFQMELKGVLEENLIKTETEAAVMKMLLDFLRDPENEYALLPATTADMATMTESYNELILKRMSVEQNARGDNKVLQNLNQQITAMRGSIVESLAKAYQSAAIGLNEVRSRKGSNDASISKLPEQQRKMLGLARDQLIKEKILSLLLRQREETAMQIEDAIPKGTIVDEAYNLPKPLGLSKIVLILLGLFVGLAIPPFILYMRKSMGGRLETPREVNQASKMRYAGQMAHIDNLGGRVPDWSATDATEDVRKIRMELLRVLSKAGGKNILVTSMAPAVGTTMVASQIAMSIAAMGKRVAIVDLNLRKPAVETVFGLDSARGVTDYLRSASMPAAAITVSGVAEEGNLDVIPAGHNLASGPELLASQRLAQLIDELDRNYDYVVVDSADLSKTSDTMLVAPMCQATVVIVRVALSKNAEIKHANDLFASKALPNMMIVANDTIDYDAKKK